MAAGRGKLNLNFVVRLFTSRRHNKSPDRFCDRGFSLLRFSSTLAEPPLRSGDDNDDQQQTGAQSKNRSFRRSSTVYVASQPERIVVLWRQGLSGEFNGWLRKGLVPGHTRDNGARRCVNLRIGKVTKGQARRRECGLE